MKDQVKDTLDELSSLDLSKYPLDEVKSLIRQIGKFGAIVETLHQGKTIMRARPNYGDEKFTSKCQLTYKPQQFNKTFQRASTPNRTMFYGTSIPEKLEKGELDNHRVVGVLESLSWLREKTTRGYQKITFGKWVVKKNINLIALVHHEAFYNESSLTRELVENFKTFIEKYPEDKDTTIAIMDFFAKEFAKDIKQGDPDFNYLISAAFAENMVDMGLDGVFYPSVRVNGQGFNVAIKPEIADNFLALVAVGECSIYKHYEHLFVDNEAGLELFQNQTNFELIPVEPQYHAGQEKILKEMGLNSMKDLLEER